MTTVATRAGHAVDLPRPAAFNPERIAGLFRARPLGAGTFADVFRAETFRGEKLAIKRLKPAYSSPACSQSAWVMRQFEQERALLARCKSPNIVSLWADQYDLPDALVMRYISGPSLHQRLTEKLTAPEVLQLGEDMLTALHTLHNEGFIHGDVKPQNILWDGNRWVLIDFGAARPFGCPERDEVICGSYGYMPPEQQHGSFVSSATDIYSWAAVMSKALAHARDLVPTLRPILDKCLDPVPSQRPRMGALRVLLHTYRYTVRVAA